MKRHSILATASLMVLGATTASLANGAVSEFPAGGVVFKPEENISIAREDLEIGWERISVRYVFVSSAPGPVERTIGFPMAKVPLEDGPDHIGNTSRRESGDDPRNYMAFRVAVNGKPLTPGLHEYAWSGDTNVTQRIVDLGLPIFAADSDTYDKLAQLPEATRQELERDNLLVWDKLPGADWLAPKWEYQSVYEWAQTFAPGETIVEISYRPLFGAGNDYGYYYEDGEGAPLYCLDGETGRKLAGLRAENVQPQPFTVGYILQTARYWNGPIADFRLKVSDERGSLFSFCVPDGLKPVGDGEWQAKDFVPGSDLKIVFYTAG